MIIVQMSSKIIFLELASGNLTVCYGKSPCYSWESPRTKSPFSIAMLNYQRVAALSRPFMNFAFVFFVTNFETLPGLQMVRWQVCDNNDDHQPDQSNQIQMYYICMYVYIYIYVFILPIFLGKPSKMLSNQVWDSPQQTAGIPLMDASKKFLGFRSTLSSNSRK